MDLVYTPAQQRFRRELRAFLGTAVPEAWRANGGRGPRDPAERFAVVKRWMARLHEAGWAAPGWPAEHGGRGAGVVEQVIYQEELARAAAPPALNMLGVNLLGPTLIAHGTSEQTREHLPRILSGERLWCQGFSEPDAGSDLASLRTRAELHGDRFVVNGQKIWTSLASVADGIFTLVRTDPAARRHRGISYLLVDLRSPGITVRPIRQITGSSEFCEVFFDDVEVPAANLVGELHRGWEVAHTTLGHERGTAFLGSQVRYERIVRELIELSGRTSYNGAPAFDDAAIRQELARAWCELRIMRHNGFRSLTQVVKEGRAGPAGSVNRLLTSQFEQRLHELAVRLQGAQGIEVKGSPDAVQGGRWQRGYLSTRASTIGAGTAEIQRNIVSEKVLGLPPDPATSAGAPGGA